MNKQTKILLYGANIWYFGAGMLGPLFALFAEEVGGDILDVAWAWATYLVITGILYIIIGKITDLKKNKEKMMVFGYFLNAAFTFSYLFVSSPWHLFVVQAGLGVAEALATPTWNALYAKYGNARNDGLRWGLAGGQGQIITGIALIFGGFLVNIFSFDLLFLLMGTISLLAAIYQARILRNTK